MESISDKMKLRTVQNKNKRKYDQSLYISILEMTAYTST